MDPSEIINYYEYHRVASYGTNTWQGPVVGDQILRDIQGK